MKNQEITLFDMSIDILGQNSPYSVTWSSIFDKKNLIINFNSSPLILGGIGEKIRLQFSNALAFKSEHDLSIAELKLFEYEVSFIPSSELVQSGSSGVSYTFVFAMLTSLGVSLFTGGSIELMWSMANVLQIIFFYGCMNLYFTPEILTVFEIMKFSNFDNPLFEYFRTKISALFTALNFPEPPNYKKFGLSFSNIIMNFSDKLLILIASVLFVVILSLLNFLLKNKVNKFANFIKNKDLDIRYEGISRFIIEMSLSLTFVSLVNVIYGNYIALFDIVSYVIAGILLSFIFCMLIYCFLYPFVYYSDIYLYPDKHERHCLLFLEFNKENMRNLFFYGYFITHRISFIFVIVCMNDFPVHQCVIIIYIHFLILLYTFCPYKKCLVNFLHTFNNLIQFGLSCLLPLFLSSKDAYKLKVSGYVRNSFIIFFSQVYI